MSREIRVRKERGRNSNENSDISGFLNSFFVKLLLLSLSIFILYSVYNSVKIMFQKVQIHKQAQMEVDELRLQNLALSLSIKEMSTDKYLEKEARDRLNFGDNEEVVFVIPENSLESAVEDVDKLLSKREEYTLSREFTLEKWVEFVERGI